MSEPLYVDATLLRSVAACSTQAAMRHILGYQSADERIELLAGHAVHEVLEAFFKGASPKEAMDVLEVAYKPVRSLITQERFEPENVKTIVGQWLRRHADMSKFPVRVDNPELVEIGFCVPIAQTRLNRPVYYVGRIDAIGRDKQGDWWVLEHKTTKRITDYWRDRWKMDAQATGYTWAARQTIGEKVVGVMVNAIELGKLPSDPKRKCVKHGVVFAECGVQHAEWAVIPTTRSDELIQSWMRDVVHLAERYGKLVEMVQDVEDMQKVRMQGLWNFSCAFCSFKDWCSSGRQAQLVESMLVHDPWQPFPIPTA